MATLTFYGGVNEVGGNKILLEDREARLWLDFGLSFARMGEYFAEFLQPRASVGLRDYLEMELIPKLKGAYRADLLKPAGLEHEEPRFDGVLLTHAHLDHAGCIPFLDPRIPVYCSNLTRRILAAYQVTARGGFETEFLGGKFRPFGRYISDKRWEPFTREFKGLEGVPIEVEALEVDHSTHGAYAYLIEVEGALVAYTGDLRLQGPRGKLTRRFLKTLERRSPEVLVVEGTRVEEREENRLVKELAGKLEPKLGSEAEVEQRGLELLEEAEDKPVFVDFAPRDFDRMRTLLEVARSAGRELVIPLRLAYFVRELGDDLGLRLKDFLIYVEPKRLGAYDRREYVGWERDFLELENSMRPQEIRERLEELVVYLGYFDLQNLVDLKPRGGYYLHASSEPFSEEQALDFARFKRWLERFGLRYKYLHASGHCSREETFELVERSRAKQVFPVHTLGARLLKARFGGRVKVPKLGKPFKL